MRSLLPFLLCACAPSAERGLVITARSSTTINVGESQRFDIESLDESMPFRISLFAGDVVSDSGGTLRFADDDGDGVAERGAPTEWAFFDLYTDEIDTLPATDDDPAEPEGLYDQAGSGWKHLRPQVTGVQAGTVWLVAHENGGLSTHLEIDEDGESVELYSALALTIVE